MSEKQDFWRNSSFALVGHSARMRFPVVTLDGLRRQKKEFFVVDPSMREIEGIATYPDLRSLPKAVEAMAVEVPSDETASWLRKAHEAGIRRVWIHRGCESREALEFAREKGITAVTGSCAVMYLMPRVFPHGLHRWLTEKLGRY
jgi:predicted CoA-binding protein